jgi:hypothetical protein
MSQRKSIINNPNNVCLLAERCLFAALLCELFGLAEGVGAKLAWLRAGRGAPQIL